MKRRRMSRKTGYEEEVYLEADAKEDKEED